jgi:glycosyltransferase involved in cell wall biosynthesis
MWRDDGPVRKLARRLPPWAKRLARRLLGLADRIARRYSTPKAVGISFPRSRIVAGRETVLLIIHEGTRTGAPILGWNLTVELLADYNVVVLLRRGGPLREVFEATASAVICLPDDFPLQPRQIEPLARQLYDTYAPTYAIANSVESRFIVAELEALSIPVVALVHEFSSGYRPVGLLHGLFKTASAIVFPARIVADSASADYKILQARDFSILPQGPSKLPWLGAGRRGEAAAATSDSRASDDPGHEFCVVGIGTITMRKGVDLFIAAAGALRQMLPDRKIRFVWAGSHFSFDQPYFDALQQQLRENRLNDSVELLGELDDLDPVYRRADVFLLSSRLDPLPNVAIDSALRGLPIVCFDQTSGIAELLMKHEDTRDLVVPHLDAKAAAAAICELATDPARLHRVSTAIAGIAQAHFNMQGYVRQIDGLGTRARQSLDGLRPAQKIILQRGAFNPDLHFGHEADSWSAETGIWKYLADSRLAAPWNKPLAGTFMRRPLEGFNPLIYACENPGFDPRQLEDPLAHFIRNDRPPGRWTHRVLTPAPNDGHPLAALKVAVHGHFHYPELLPDFIQRLHRNGNSFDLFLSTTTQAKADHIAGIVAEFALNNVDITVGGNRGRDLAPFLKGLREGRYSGYDVVGHFHGKRSVHVDSTIGDGWRNFLWEHLVGGQFAMADVILRAIAEDPRLGLVFAEDPHLNGWDENLEIAEALAARMKFSRPLPAHFDFPIGTMFWARPRALEPLLRLDLRDDDFPPEPLPIDGTLLHALERMIPFAAAEAGMAYATTYVRDSKR